MDYKKKYLKYKLKYLTAKKLYGGMDDGFNESPRSNTPSSSRSTSPVNRPRSRAICLSPYDIVDGINDLLYKLSLKEDEGKKPPTQESSGAMSVDPSPDPSRKKKRPISPPSPTPPVKKIKPAPSPENYSPSTESLSPGLPEPSTPVQFIERKNPDK